MTTRLYSLFMREPFWSLVVSIDVVAYGHNELFEVLEDATPDSVFRQVAEEALHHIQPRRTGGREVYVEARMPFQPPLHLGVFVRGVVVGDQVQGLPGWRHLVDHA